MVLAAEVVAEAEAAMQQGTRYRLYGPDGSLLQGLGNDSLVQALAAAASAAKALGRCRVENRHGLFIAAYIRGKDGTARMA